MLRRKPIRKDGERGFALLLVFLMAAVVSIMLYREMPRVAFETVRDREQLLMDRGNQYTRAINVFYQVNKRYPATIDELEKTNQQRFLRRRYKDPMNGSEEWRLIHSNGAYLTDSLVEKPPAQNAGQGQVPGGGPLGSNTMNTAMPAATNPTDPNAPNQVNRAVQRRASDRQFPGQFPGQDTNDNADQDNQNQTADQTPPITNNPASFPPITIGPVGDNGQPVTLINNGLQANAPLNGQGATDGQAGGNFNGRGGNANLPGTLPQGVIPSGAIQPGVIPQQGQQNGFPGFAPSTNNNGNVSNTVPGFVPVLPQNNQNNGAFPGAASNPALQSIAGQLGAARPQTPTNTATNANPFQLSGAQPGAAGAAGGVTGSPGIAGVASRYEGPSIKAFKEREKYQEWEFVYKPAAPTAGAAGAAPGGVGGANGGGRGPGQNGQGPNGPGQNGQGQFGNGPQTGNPNGRGGGNGINTNPGFGGSGPFNPQFPPITLGPVGGTTNNGQPNNGGRPAGLPGTPPPGVGQQGAGQGGRGR